MTTITGPPKRRITMWVLVAAVIALGVLSAAVAVALAREPAAVVDKPRIALPKPSPTPSGPRPELRPVGYWEEQFDAGWADELQMSDPQSKSADSWDHYELSYDIDSNTAMFEATGKTQYLDRALHYVNNVVASAKPSSSLPTSQYHDKYLGWVSNQKDLDRPGTEVPLYESYLWRYATTTLRVMRQTPAVYDDPKYRAQYDKLLAFAETNIFEKWYQRGANDNIYRDAVHIASHWALIALNLSQITDDAGRRDQYRTVVDNIDLHMPNAPSSLHQQLRGNPVDPTAYFWAPEWGSYERPGQDVSHANNVIAYITEAHDHGDKSWTDGDMDGFVALVGVIWPSGTTYHDFVDGTGEGNGWFSDGFVKLGRYSPALQHRLDGHQVVNHQFIANMALNAKVLG
jgi:hypothetical protein